MSKPEKASKDKAAAAAHGALASLLEPLSAASGEVLIAQRTPADTLYLIDEGTLEVRLETAHGPVSLGTKGPGEWVGELGMIAPGPGSATVVATSAAQLRPVPHAAYLDLLETQPKAMGEALYRIAAEIARRLRRSAEAQAQPGLDLTLSQLRMLQGLDKPAAAGATAPRRAADRQMPRVDPTALLRTLEHVGLFAAGDAREMTRAAGLKKALGALAATGLSVQTFLHGEAIVQAGERADGAFILLGGSASVVSASKEASKAAGTDAPLGVETMLAPGTLFGHQAFFDDHVRQASVHAVGTAVVAVLWPGAVDEILRQAQAGTPVWLPLLDWIARRLAEDARQLNRRLQTALESNRPRR